MSDNAQHLERNLAAVESEFGTLAGTIGSADIPADCTIRFEREIPRMSLNGKLVHSAREPAREAARLVDSVLEGRPAVAAIFLGFGLGYYIEYALETQPHLHCVVYEPDPGMLKAAFSARDCTATIQSGRLSIITEADPEALAPIMEKLSRDRLVIIRNRPLYERHEREYRELESHVDNYFQRREINHNTLVRFGRRWVRNLAENLHVVARSTPITRLKDSFSGIPALLLAGGPSLDEALPRIRDLYRRMVIIAVDTSLHAALRAGVTPDYVVVVDPQYWNTRHLDAATGSECDIISESSTHPRVFRLLKGPVSMCSSLFPLGRFIEDAWGSEFGTLGAGGSVATTAWDFARYIGCNPIYCAGLDLAFPRHNTHFRGSFFESRALTWCRRDYPVETMAFSYLHSGQCEQVRANNGQHVLSDTRMRIYRWWFETQMRRYPETTTVTLSNDGAFIDGMPAQSIDSALSLPECRRRISQIRQQKSAVQRSGHERGRRHRMQRLRVRLDELTGELSSIEGLARRALTVTERAYNQRRVAGHIGAEPLAELDSIDSRITEHKYRDIAGFLLQEVKERVRTGNEPDPLIASKLLYEGLEESSRYHRKLLERGVRRLTDD